MKLLLIIWISAVLTQEVFSNTLVRRPRHALNKPTSSVHTEYEATYEQKGKQGNESYSTVSGKQEVVHDNCGDNWNAFADKCASLIKDLVASLGNAVSSKPGDATNLQLRIRNTFRHFDSTDNCTCLNNTKDALSSLFNNITINTVQPVAINGAASNHSSKCENGQSCNNGRNAVASTICEGEFCNVNTDDQEKALHRHPKLLQQKVGQPKFTVTSPDVDPETADTSKESSTNNSRRGAKYPTATVKAPSGNSGADAADSKQVLPVSPASTDSKKIPLPNVVTTKAVGSPAGAVIPHSQTENSPKNLPITSSGPSQTLTLQNKSANPALPIDHPAKNNDIVKSDISVKPAPALSSASRISSPDGSQRVLNNPSNDSDNDEQSRAGSAQIPDVTPYIIPPMLAPLKPVNNVAQDNEEGSPSAANASSNQAPAVIPVIPKVRPVKGTVVQPQITSTDSEGNGSGSHQAPVVKPVVPAVKPVGNVVAEPQITTSDGEGSPAANNAGANQTPVVIPAVPKVKPVNGAAAKPQVTSSDNGEDCDDDENGGGTAPGSNQTPVVIPAVPKVTPAKVAVAKPKVTSSNSGGNESGSNQTPVVIPVIPKVKPVEDTVVQPQITSSDSEGDDAGTAGNGSGSIQAPVVKPVVPAVKPVGQVVAEPAANNAGSSPTPIVIPAVPEVKPAKGAVAKPQVTTSNSGGNESGSNQTPVVIPVIPKVKPVKDTAVQPQITSADSEGDDAGTTGNGSGSIQAPVVKPVVPAVKPVGNVVAEPQITTSVDEGSPAANNPGSSQTPVVIPAVPKVKPVNGAAAKPQVTSSDNGEDCDDDENGGGTGPGSNQTPVVKPVVPAVKPVKDTVAEPQITTSDGEGSPAANNAESSPTPVVIPAVPKVTPAKVAVAKPKVTSSNSGGNESGSNLTPVVIPAVPKVKPVEDVAAEPQIPSTGDEGSHAANTDASKGIPIVTPKVSSSQPQVVPANGGADSDSGSNQNPVIVPAGAPMKPVNNIAQGTLEGSPEPSSDNLKQTPIVVPVVPVVPTEKPDNGAVAKPGTTSSNGEEDCDDEEAVAGNDGGSNQAPVLTPVVPKVNPVNAVQPEIIPSTSGGNKDEGTGAPAVSPVLSEVEPVNGAVAEPQATSTNSKGDVPIVNQTPAVTPVATEPQITASNSEGSPAAPVITPVKPVGGVVAEPQITTSDGEGSPAASNAGSNQTPVVIPAVPKVKPVNGAVAKPQVTTNNNGGNDHEGSAGSGSGSNQTPVVIPTVAKVKPVNGAVATPQVTPSDNGEDCDDDESGGGTGSGSSQTPVVKPVVPAVKPVGNVVAEPQITTSDGEGSPAANNAASSQTPVVIPAVPKVKPVKVAVAKPKVTTNNNGGNDHEGSAGSGSGSNQTPVVIPTVANVKPVNGAVAKQQVTSSDNGEDCDDDENGGGTAPGSNQTPVVIPAVPKVKPAKVAVAKPKVTTNNNGGNDHEGSAGSGSGSNQTPVVIPTVANVKPVNGAVAKPQVTSSDNGEDCDDDESGGGTGSGSNQTPVVIPAVPKVKPVETVVAAPQITTGGDEGSPAANDAGSNQATIDTPVEPVVEPNNGAAVGPQIVSNNEGDNNGGGSAANDSEPSQNPVIIPIASSVEPQIASTNNDGDNDGVGTVDNGSGSDKGTVVQPVTSSVQDPSTIVSDKTTNVAPIPDSSLVVPAMPVSNSDDSQTPAITQANGSTQEVQLPEDQPASGTVNVIPGLIVKQPQDEPLAHKDPSSVVPIINSNSNLPESSGPAHSGGTVNPSPIYVPLPTAPSSTPSSNSAVINKNPEQATTDQEVMSGVPPTTEHDKTGADQNISVIKGIPVPPVANQRSQGPSKTATSLTTGKAANEPNGKVFIVTPVPTYPQEKDTPVVKPADQTAGNSDVQTSSGLMAIPNVQHTKGPVASKPHGSSGAAGHNENQSPVTPIYTVPVKLIPGKSKPESQSLQLGANDPSNTAAVVDPQIAKSQPEIVYTTPIPVQFAKLIPASAVNAVKSEEGSGSGNPLLQQHPLYSNFNNKKSASGQPVGTEGQVTKPDSHGNDHSSMSPESSSVGGSQPAATPTELTDDSDLTKPTTFQTTSTGPTPPQPSIQSPPPLKISLPVTQPSSLPQDSDETAHNIPTTTPHTAHPKVDDDDDEDCCSCESCTEEEISNPREYKEMACKDLEEARKELKAIFDKIKKKLKCGRKAPPKILAS